MTEHDLKTWPEYYDDVAQGNKPFEYRLNDRNYAVGDVLHLREWVPPVADEEASGYDANSTGGYYTGRSLRKRITYVLDIGKLGPAAGVRLFGSGGQEGAGNLHRHVVMGLGPLYVGPDIEPQPWVPMTDPQDIKVIGKLMEELGETVTAAARSLIQGIDGTEPSSGRPNRLWLQNELADVLGNAKLTIERFSLDNDAVITRSVIKYDFIKRWLGLMSA
jgi:hypothetical protein